MKIQKDIVSLSVLISVSILMGAQDHATEWVLPADIKNDALRKLCFENIISRKINGENSPNIDLHIEHNAGKIPGTRWGQFGANMPYHGPIEQKAYTIIETCDRDAIEPLACVVLACGTGRTVIDIVKKTCRTNIIANDLCAEQLEILKQMVNTLQIMDSRIQTNCNDSNDLIEQFEDNSIDFYYVANLIHFFETPKIRLLLQGMQRTLKQDGYIFLSWMGYDKNLQYANQMHYFCEKLKQTLDQRIENSDINEDEKQYISGNLSKNYISSNFIAKLANEYGFHIFSNKSYYQTFVESYDKKKREIYRCFYKFDNFTKQPRDIFPIFQLILTKKLLDNPNALDSSSDDDIMYCY